MAKDIIFLEGARTPFCLWGGGTRADGVTKGGTLKPLDHFDLAAAALKGALRRSGLEASAVDKIIFGNTYAVGPHACYGARYVGHRAGVPPEVPGITVNMACASGLLSIIQSADAITHGEAKVAAATGGDSSSNVARNVFIPSFNDLMCNRQIALVAQDSSKADGLSREDQDRWALRSHQRASEARMRGLFNEEIVPVTLPEGGAVVDKDDTIIDDPKPEIFAGSKILFEGEQATSHNTHAVVDGGSAILLAGEDYAHHGKATGRFVGSAVVGVRAQDMANASVKAINQMLPKIGWTKDSVDLWEINETFASQTIVAVKELGLDPDKVNVNGGALAIGHPFGATGPRLALTLLKELKRRGKKRGVAAICAGSGAGVSVAVETV